MWAIRPADELQRPDLPAHCAMAAAGGWARGRLTKPGATAGARGLALAVRLLSAEARRALGALLAADGLLAGCVGPAELQRLRAQFTGAAVGGQDFA